MATTWCPDLSDDAAATLVGTAHDLFIERGTLTYDQAMTLLNELGSITLDPTEFSVAFNYANPQATYTRPTKPDLDEDDLAFQDPGSNLPAAPIYYDTAVEIESAPAWDDVVAPNLSFGVKPNTPTVAVPVAPADAEELVMPVSPDYVLPEVPTFESLNLPAVPNIVLPEWDIERPALTDPEFNETWTFQYEAYTSTLVDTLVSTLTPMIQEPQGLPEHIERALFERNRSRIEVEANRAVDQAYTDLSNRGFDIPQGVLFDQVRQIRQGAQNSIAEASREITIEQMRSALEQQRFAITTGAALEATLIQLYSLRQQYLLEAAKFQRESALAVLNYRVQVLQLHLQAYQTDAAVYRDRIQAELAKCEVYKAELDGQRLIGEMNQQLVQRYVAQLQAVQTLADIYKTDVETVRVQADIQMQAITKYKAQIDSYAARWNAFESEVQAYSAGNQAEVSKVDVYRGMVDANAKRTDAWATASNIEVKLKELDISAYSAQLDAWKTNLQKLEALLGVERARLAAVGQSWDAQARIYTASADVETAASAAADRSFELGLTRERADVDTQLKVAEMKMADSHFLAQQMIELQKAIAQIASQLASSTMSAVNYGASVGSTRSKSNSCTSNFSFQGEIGDA